MDSHPEGVALGPQGGELISRGEHQLRILAELAEFEVIDVRSALRLRVCRSTLTTTTLTRSSTRGGSRVTVGGANFLAGQGSYVAAPAGVQHGFRNAGTGDLRLLNIHAPNVGFAEGLRG